MSEPGVRKVRSDEQVKLFDESVSDGGRGKPSIAALDELFTLTKLYRSKSSFHELVHFIARFRFYSPYNAMLVHLQMPGARFVASPSRWKKNFGRSIRPGARPLVILQPRGPVMFVFDVKDTEPDRNAPPLPMEVTNPFAVEYGRVGRQLEMTISNAVRDGVRITERDAGSQSAGQIGATKASAKLKFQVKSIPEPEFIDVPLRYELLLNRDHSREEKFATLAHELAHLYCGHIGTPNPDWWMDRSGQETKLQEFEAESVCYLVCERIGVKNPSAQYLSGYLKEDGEIPPISLEGVMKAAGLIEQMGQSRMKPRKEKEKGTA